MAQNRSTIACLIGEKQLQSHKLAHVVMDQPMAGNGNGNGTGVQQGQGNATYGSTQFGGMGRNGRDGMTVKDLVAMPSGKKT
jgi:hypothetical protein